LLKTKMNRGNGVFPNKLNQNLKFLLSDYKLPYAFKL
jgi:hypothetical protein